VLAPVKVIIHEFTHAYDFHLELWNLLKGVNTANFESAGYDAEVRYLLQNGALKEAMNVQYLRKSLGYYVTYPEH
jgi:hypothetical protein